MLFEKGVEANHYFIILKQAQSMEASVYSPSNTSQSSTVKW